MDREPVAVKLYLDLLKKALINELDLENKLRAEYIQERLSEGVAPDPVVARDILLTRAGRYHELLNRQREGQYRLKSDSPCWPFTLIGKNRLENIQDCLDRIRLDNIPGDCVETGVWRGGATIFMRGYLKAYDMDDRCVWLADSFQGLPAAEHPLEGAYDFSSYDILSINREIVEHNFALFELMDDKVRFLPGWFKDTLPDAPIDQISLLRLDGDMFESTLTALSALYPRLAPGGFVIIDDYGSFEPCRHAVHAYRVRHNISAAIEWVDQTCAYWRK